MKVSIYISSLSGGGAERVCCNLANYLIDKGNHVEILTVSKIKENHYDLNKKVKNYSLERSFRFNISFLRVFIKLLRLFVYIRNNDADIYVVMLPKVIKSFLIFKPFVKVPIIFSERAVPSKYDKRTQRFLIKVANTVDAIVYQTEEAKQWYESRSKNCRGVVIPNAINPIFIRKKFCGEKEKVIVSAGRLVEQKNFSMLINAFAKITNEYSNYKLKICGDGPLLKQLQQQVKNLGVDEKVEFLGFVEDMTSLLEKSSLFVLPSDFEGMPNVLMEAMALGVPVISTDCLGGGPRFLIKSGENGLLIPMNDTEALVNAIKKMLSDSSFAEKCGMNARHIVEELNPEKIYGQWETLLKQVISLTNKNSKPI